MKYPHNDFVMFQAVLLFRTWFMMKGNLTLWSKWMMVFHEQPHGVQTFLYEAASAEFNMSALTFIREQTKNNNNKMLIKKHPEMICNSHAFMEKHLSYCIFDVLSQPEPHAPQRTYAMLFSTSRSGKAYFNMRRGNSKSSSMLHRRTTEECSNNS